MAETATLEAASSTEADSLRLTDAPAAVSVDIYDQVYHLRGVAPEYIEGLAAMVNEKMRAVSEHGGTVDSLRVAVLAALNIADELCTLRQQYEHLAGSRQTAERSLRSRADSLVGMLDEVLAERRVG